MISEQKRIRTLLEERIRQFKAWSDCNPKAESQLTIRKFPCKAELIDFRISKQQPLGQAKIKVIFSNKRQVWFVELQLSIFTRTIRKTGYEDIKPGIYFHTTPNKNQKPELIKSYKIIMKSVGAYTPADFNEWYRYWLQRIFKDPTIKILFAKKILISDKEEDAENHIQEVSHQ